MVLGTFSVCVGLEFVLEVSPILFQSAGTWLHLLFIKLPFTCSDGRVHHRLSPPSQYWHVIDSGGWNGETGQISGARGPV